MAAGQSTRPIPQPQSQAPVGRFARHDPVVRGDTLCKFSADPRGRIYFIIVSQAQGGADGLQNILHTVEDPCRPRWPCSC